MRRYFTGAGLLILAVAVAYVALNWGYFSKLVGYYADRPRDEGQEQAPQPGTKVEANRIWIKALGIDAPIVYTDARDEAGFQVALRSGVVHYPDTALPGEPGNAYFFGHSSDYLTAPGDYKTVFALLPQIKVGDRVEVSGQDGTLHVYAVTERFVANPDDTHLLDQDTTKHQLTLQTSYPIGTALQRYIVVAQKLE